MKNHHETGMILLIDAGNTRIKWALAEPGSAPGHWHASGALMHAAVEQLPGALDAALAGRSVGRALLSNVAGDAMRERLQQMLPASLAPDLVKWFASRPQLAGLRNGYRDPGQLEIGRAHV